MRNQNNINNPNYKHGLGDSRIMRTWVRMKYRCNNPNCSMYKNYGGRGIKVCNEWLDKENGFINFYNWAIKNGYTDDLSIDRIDNDKGYFPDNCQWITVSENTAKANKGKVKRKANKGMYYGISPIGEYYEFFNASEFARNHKLDDKLLRAMANGTKYTTKLYNGWKFGFVIDKCVSTIRKE